jgi:hypothetical protein
MKTRVSKKTVMMYIFCHQKLQYFGQHWAVLPKYILDAEIVSGRQLAGRCRMSRFVVFENYPPENVVVEHKLMQHLIALDRKGYGYGHLLFILHGTFAYATQNNVMILLKMQNEAIQNYQKTNIPNACIANSSI